MENTDRKLLEQSCKHALLDLVVDNKILRENTSFHQHKKICERITKMTYEESISYVFNEGKLLNEFGIRDFEGKFKKFAKYSFATLAGAKALSLAVPGGVAVAPAIIVSVLMYYLYRKFTDPCWQACVKKFSPGRKKLCIAECQVNAAKNIVNDIRSEISKCHNMPNPMQCEKSLRTQHIKWAKKLQEEIIKMRIVKSKYDELDRQKKEKERKKEVKK